jgi:ribosome-interacting GTPase 1
MNKEILENIYEDWLYSGISLEDYIEELENERDGVVEKSLLNYLNDVCDLDIEEYREKIYESLNEIKIYIKEKRHEV